jgi:peroxiredoxin
MAAGLSVDVARAEAPQAQRKTETGSGQAPQTPVKDEEVVFKDDIKTNVEVPKGLEGLAFLDTNGKRVAMESFLGRKNVVLVFTEGFTGMLCPFCKTQTSRLVANYEKFKSEDAEILVVYPGTRERLDEFMIAARTTDKKQVDAVPFPILLDEDFGGTEFFKIRSNLAHPSTFIIDKKGNVRLAYVGADMTADRPSVSAMLGVLKAANDN